jgi:hypothetical protein
LFNSVALISCSFSSRLINALSFSISASTRFSIRANNLLGRDGSISEYLLISSADGKGVDAYGRAHAYKRED